MAYGKLFMVLSKRFTAFELTRPAISVGRQPGNDLLLATSTISRYHAQFVVDDGQLYLVDLGSINGSFVNGQRVEPDSRVALKHSDVIQLGDFMMLYAAPDPALEAQLLRLLSEYVRSLRDKEVEAPAETRPADAETLTMEKAAEGTAIQASDPITSAMIGYRVGQRLASVKLLVELARGPNPTTAAAAREWLVEILRSERDERVRAVAQKFLDGG